ncbi:MAG TPA: right-handed parallel beta-helix repeat-containing protein [Candidatus Binataceae bacterium]|nr:right-handed parallel beta-helix repeat-containing protein [Candidatus Binataceae bacterium]
MPSRRAALAATIVAIGLLSASAARAATITVGTLNDSTGVGDCSLRDAISTTNGADVAGSGCPSPTADPSNTISFSLAGSIALTSTLPPLTGNLSITRPIGSERIKLDGGDKYPVMMVRAGAVVNLLNLEIEHGMRIAVGFGFDAGGIDNAGTLTIRDSAFFGNQARGAGLSAGGISNLAGATLTVINSAFVSNIAGVASGGGIFNRGTLTVTNSGFSRNSGTVAGGGGIENYTGGRATVTNTTFSLNVGNVGGAGIFNDGAIAVANSTFYNNRARAGSGGILNRGTLTVTNSTFSANNGTGGDSAGAIDNLGALTVTNSTFSDNRATLSGNRTTLSGGVGGAIFNRRDSTLQLHGTIMAGSSSGGNCAGQSIIDRGYNISDDKSCAFSAVGSKNNTDPKLSAAGLTRNGGPTSTIALQPDSPAIDAIPFASCTDQATPPNQLTTDQRGEPRPDPEDGPTGPCDIGAYESGELPPLGCSQAAASAPILWPANHKFVFESVLGAADVKITAIHQDEPVANTSHCADASGVGSSLAQVRAERDGAEDGRVYHLDFTATDPLTNTSCSGEVKICVPHDRAHRTCGDQGALYDSTVCRACAHTQARCSQ